MRLDKFLANINRVPRRQYKKIAKKGLIAVNHEEIRDGGHILVPGDLIEIGEYHVVYKETLVILLHKPAGYISHDQDEHGWPSYRHLLDGHPYAPLLHSAGRLDQDTTGLLVLSNDGDLIHRLISPKTHCPKTYHVVTKKFVSDKDLARLQKGVVLDTGYTTQAAQTERINKQCFHLTITEGKFHQVKKMLTAIGNEVASLHRVSVGPYHLQDLAEGERREWEPTGIASQDQKEPNESKESHHSSPL